MIELKVGDTGLFKFKALRNNGDKQDIKCFGRVLYVTTKFSLIEDNNEHPYLILSQDLKEFKARNRREI